MSLEYRVYSLQSLDLEDFQTHLQTVLNRFGEDGWKMVHMETGIVLAPGFIVFERLKPSNYSHLQQITPEILEKAKAEHRKS